MAEWIDRASALEKLGVRPQTLYAYVSRGRVGMRPDPNDSRRSLYSAEDIAALTTRRERGRRPSAIAASAISWGEPAIETSISTVIRGRLVYRGQDAVKFARHATLEEAAALLWGMDTVSFPSHQERDGEVFTTLAALARDGVPMIGRALDRLHGDAMTAIGRIAVALGAEPGDGPVHERLARGWSMDMGHAELIRMALVLLADHELNASTFAARVSASTGSAMAANLLAGYCALTGPRHGSAGVAVGSLIHAIEREGVKDMVSFWAYEQYKPPAGSDHQLSPPGFGHPLYPNGDPRAAALLDRVPLDTILSAFMTAVIETTGALPNIDFALAALTRSCKLPRHAPYRLFTLGRSIGWAAHAIEQVTTSGLIRPRAIYRGKPIVAD